MAVCDALCEVRLFDAGADGYLSDCGQNFYDALAESFPRGVGSVATAAAWQTAMLAQEIEMPADSWVLAGAVYTEWVTGFSSWTQPALMAPEALGGLTCTPVMRRQSAMTAAYWTPSVAADWDLSVKLPCDVPMLVASSLNALADHYSTLTSKFDLPVDPDFWVELVTGAPSWDNLEPPYAAVLWGGGTWAVALTAGDKSGIALYRLVGGTWEWCLDLKTGKGKLQAFGKDLAGDYLSLLVLHRRGRLLLSTDDGSTWSAYDDGAGTVVPQGAMTFYNKGQWSYFALQQAAAVAGVYASPQTPLFEARGPGALPANRMVADRHYHQPSDSLIVVTVTKPDALEPTAFAYQAGLYPYMVTPDGAPFAFFRCPTLVAVEYEYPAVLVAPAPLAYISLADLGLVTGISVKSPQEEGADTAAVQLLQNPALAFTGEYRWRYLEVDLGFSYDNGSTQLWPVFAGYVDTPHASMGPEWEQGCQVELQCIGAAWKAKGVKLHEGHRPLDALSVNAALDYLLSQTGRSASQRSWHGDGGLFYLAAGPAEKPLWWRTNLLPCGTTAWDAMQKVAQVAGLALRIRNDGVWETFVPETFNTAVVHALVNDLSADRTEATTKVQNTAESLEGNTGELAKGKDNDGNEAAAWLIDYDRERNPSAAPFAGCRMLHRQEGEQFADFATASRVAASAYDLGHLSQYRPGVETKGHPNVLKRECFTLQGAEAAGITPGVLHGVEELSHTWGPKLKDCSSSLVGRRLS